MYFKIGKNNVKSAIEKVINRMYQFSITNICSKKKMENHFVQQNIF